jgi:hypothetical protein
MKTSAVALVVTLAVLASGVPGASFTVEIGGTFDDNCGKAYAASAAATCSFISKMNGGKGVAIGPNKDFFLKFNFDFALYPKDGYFTNDVGVNMATAMYAKSHLIVGEGGGCNHNHGLDMTRIAGKSGKILMAPSGPSDFYKANYPSIFGMHLPSESYPLATIQQFAFRGMKTAAMVYYGSGAQDNLVVDSLHDVEVRQVHNGVPGTNNLFSGGVINEGAIVYCKQYGIKVLSVESYGDVYKDEAAFATTIHGMLMRAAATGADVLIMSTLNGDGGLVQTALKSKDLARNHIFKGIWTTGVPWGGGSCHSHYYNCSNVAGATQEYNQDFQDPLFGARANYVDFVTTNLVGSAISAADASSWDFGPKGDVGAIISAYAQAFQKAYQFRPITDTTNFINSAAEYEYYRSSLAVWSGETIFGPVSFNARRRNEGRQPTTVQMMANPKHDAKDGTSKPYVAQLVFPLIDATAAFIFPAPATEPCEDTAITNFMMITPYLVSKCNQCSADSKPDSAGTTCAKVVENRNYVPSAVKSACFAMVALNMLGTMACFIWMNVRSGHYIVKLSQPIFLSTMCLGCFISTCSIIFMTYDEESHDLAELDSACMSTVWMYCLGFTLTFMSLYVKTHRINKIINNPSLKSIKIPNSLLFKYIGTGLAVESIILVAFQTSSPLKWTRECLAYDTIAKDVCIESRGFCTSEHAWDFMMPIFILHTLLLAYALAICYKTRKIDSAFAESKWISGAIFSDLQVLLLGGALLFMVHEDTGVYCLLKAAIVFLNDGGDLWMIFLPKIVTAEVYHRGLTSDEQKTAVGEAVRKSMKMSATSKNAVQPTCFTTNTLENPTTMLFAAP